MLKKIISLILLVVTISSLAFSASANKVGDVIGTVYNTDIVVYINNYAIPSYAANGTSVVVAEDLINFGFDVIWNRNTKSLEISRNNAAHPKEMNVVKNNKPNTKFADLLYTDIKVYANGILIPSYAINGYTMIPVESLTMFGTCNWVSEERALKLWVDGLQIREQMQFVNAFDGMPYNINYYNLNKDGYATTILDVANQSGKTLDEFKKDNGLPEDMPGDTIVAIAECYITLGKMLEMQGMGEDMIPMFAEMYGIDESLISVDMYMGEFNKLVSQK